MGSSKLHKWLPDLFFFIFCRAECAEMEQAAANQTFSASLPAKGELAHLGLPQHQQSAEGVHHDIDALAEQGGTSRALPHCFSRMFITPTAVWSPCAQGAAVEDCTASPRELLPLCLTQEKEESPPDWIF